MKPDPQTHPTPGFGASFDAQNPRNAKGISSELQSYRPFNISGVNVVPYCGEMPGA
jgi:hypothetical protein